MSEAVSRPGLVYDRAGVRGKMAARGACKADQLGWCKGRGMSAMGEPMTELEKQRLLERVAQDGRALQHAVAELRGDREVVLAAMAQNGNALQYAAVELKGDREVVLAAVAQHGVILRHAAAKLKGDREVVLAAVAQHGDHALQYAAVELKGDHEVVLAAVAQHGGALRHATKELKGDREVVLVAVAQSGYALQYAAAKLKGDHEVVLAAVAQHGAPALRHAAAELRTDALLLKMSSLNPRLSAVLLVAQLRLYLAYACHERVGSESLLRCLPLEVIELIGQQMTVHVTLHSLVCRLSS